MTDDTWEPLERLAAKAPAPVPGLAAAVLARGPPPPDNGGSARSGRYRGGRGGHRYHLQRWAFGAYGGATSLERDRDRAVTVAATIAVARGGLATDASRRRGRA